MSDDGAMWQTHTCTSSRSLLGQYYITILIFNIAVANFNVHKINNIPCCYDQANYMSNNFAVAIVIEYRIEFIYKHSYVHKV